MPKFLTSTGIQKSGNSWLVKMLDELINGTNSTWKFASFFDLHDLIARCSSFRRESRQPICVNDLAVKLLNNTGSFELPRQSAAGKLFQQEMRRLALRIRWNLARADRVDSPSVQEIYDEILGRLERTSKPTEQVAFLPAKHVPPGELSRNFPDWHLVWLIRDPRDCLVSYFFHDLSTLTPEKIPWFIESCERKGNSAAWKVRDDWMASYFSRRIQHHLEFFRQSRALRKDGLLIRYEDLLSDCPGTLQGIVQSFGLSIGPDQVKQVSEKYQFRTLTGSKRENFSSFVRRGTAGQWQERFDQTFRELFSGEILELICELGYEPDHQWLERLPERAAEPFDLKRYRHRSSAVYASRPLWLDHENWQVDFPRPFHWSEEPNYFQWLMKSDDRQIANWRSQMQPLVDLADSDEPDERHQADRLLGY